MSTLTGTTDYVVQAAGGQVTIASSTDYVVTDPSAGTFSSTTNYVVVDPTTTTTFSSSTGYVVTSRPAVFLRQGSSLVRVQLGIRQGDQIVWLSPPVP